MTTNDISTLTRVSPQLIAAWIRRGHFCPPKDRIGREYDWGMPDLLRLYVFERLNASGFSLAAAGLVLADLDADGAFDKGIRFLTIINNPITGLAVINDPELRVHDAEIARMRGAVPAAEGTGGPASAVTVLDVGRSMERFRNAIRALKEL